eukprot:m.111809 g.111809  ORF g.111809 m.111809 type:complete len:149 (+) comp15960_c0_seq5:787-1233(+)
MKAMAPAEQAVLSEEMLRKLHTMLVKSAEQVGEEAAKFRAKMEPLIRADMRWRGSCRNSKALFKAEWPLSREAFAMVFGPPNRPPNKQDRRKMAPEKLFECLQCEEICGHARYDTLHMSSDVTVTHDMATLQVKISGRYGKEPRSHWY